MQILFSIDEGRCLIMDGVKPPSRKIKHLIEYYVLNLLEMIPLRYAKQYVCNFSKKGPLKLLILQCPLEMHMAWLNF